jgi:hypothetical protein
MPSVSNKDGIYILFRDWDSETWEFGPIIEVKIDKLQTQMMGLLVEERDRLAQLIRDNTAALQELQKTIFTYMVKNNE